MALAAKDLARLYENNLGGNQIGEKGCEFLTKSNWCCLKILGLSSNNIEIKGLKHLCQSNWS